jgi:uncharacterized protein (DUF58 family)
MEVSEMRRLLLVLFLIVAVSAVAATGAAARAPGISASPSHINFGRVAVGQTVAKSITLTNRTGSHLTYSSNSQPTYFGFSTQNCWQIYLDDSCTSTMVFTPTATGRFGGTWSMTFTDDAGGSWTAVWKVSGAGI